MSGAWIQLCALVWLRWRLLVNMVSTGKLSDKLAGLLLGLLALGGAVGGGLALGLVGARVLPGARDMIPVAWHGVVAAFLVATLSGMMASLQRSEAIDIKKLLHLPVSVRQVFVLNFLASLATPSILLFAPWMVGLGLGLALGVGPRMLLVLPLSLSVLLAVAAWSYMLRGWLAPLLENRRKRRTVVVAVTLGIVLLAQLPNLVGNVSAERVRRTERSWRKRANQAFAERLEARGLPEEEAAELRGAFKARLLDQSRALREGGMTPIQTGVDIAQAFLPPGWPGFGASRLAAGEPGVALLATLAGLLVTGWGLRRGWLTTLAYYTGRRHERASTSVQRRGESRLLERRLPGLPEDVAGLTLASLRMLLREPQLKLACIPLFFVAVLLFLIQPGPLVAGVLRASGPLYVAPLVMLIMMQFTANLFGMDREGYRTLVLLPTPRQRLLLAKNLALLPVTLVLGSTMLVLSALFQRPPASALLLAWLQLPVAHVLLSLTGNVSSILLPWRWSSELVARSKLKPLILLSGLAQLLFSLVMVFLVMTPVVAELVVGHFVDLGGVPLDLILTLVLLVLLVWFYSMLLPLMGELLAGREQRILEALTQPLE